MLLSSIRLITSLHVLQYASPDISPLSGCVNDARSFKAFLTDCLHVPGSQIMLLTNKTATRSAVLNTFQKHFTNNTNIDEGDAIVFFYAGHGSRVMAPEGWPAMDGKIETICPYDERMKDKDGDIYGIPDRTINIMFRDLAAKKGNNIVRSFTLSRLFYPAHFLWFSDCHLRLMSFGRHYTYNT